MATDSTSKKCALREEYMLDWNGEIPGFETKKEQGDTTTHTDSESATVDPCYDRNIALHILQEGRARANGDPPAPPVGDIEFQAEQPSSGETSIGKTSPPFGRSARVQYFIFALCLSVTILVLMKRIHSKLTEKH